MSEKNSKLSKKCREKFVKKILETFFFGKDKNMFFFLEFPLLNITMNLLKIELL
jgi:hypothetical protein